MPLAAEGEELGVCVHILRLSLSYQPSIISYARRRLQTSEQVSVAYNINTPPGVSDEYVTLMGTAVPAVFATNLAPFGVTEVKETTLSPTARAQTPTSSSNDTLVLVGVGVGSAAGVFLGIMLFGFYRRRRARRGRRGQATRSPAVALGSAEPTALSERQVRRTG